MIFFIFLLFLLTLFIYHKNTTFEKFKNKNIEHIDNIEHTNNIENINITISNQEPNDFVIKDDKPKAFEPYYNPFDYGYYFPYNNMWYNNLYY